MENAILQMSIILSDICGREIQGVANQKQNPGVKRTEASGLT